MCRNAIKEYRPLHTLPVFTQKNGEMQPLHTMYTQNQHCDLRYTQVFINLYVNYLEYYMYCETCLNWTFLGSTFVFWE